MRPDPERVEVLSRVRAPSNQTELRSMLGFFGHYRQYIPQFARLTQPLTKMLKSGAVVTWNDEKSVIQQTLVKALKDAALWIPLGAEKFRIATDASQYAVGGVLEVLVGSEWRPVEFTSKTLTGSQLRWPVREKEAFAIVWSVQKFDAYIRGRAIEVLTDHQNLQWLFNAKEGKLARWTTRLAEYGLTIIYRPGTEMEHVDFLSRYLEPKVLDEAERTKFPGIGAVVEDADLLSKTDWPTLPSFDEIVEGQRASQKHPGRGYFVSNDVIYYLGKLWVPPSLRSRVLAASHAAPPYLHPGKKKTKARISRLFQWPNIHRDVAEYLRSCLVCQRVRIGAPQRGKTKVHPMSTPFHTVYMDIWTCTFRGTQRKLLTLIDRCTRWTEAIPIEDSTAATIASALLKQWVCRFGVPRVLISDRAKEFTSKILDDLCGKLGTEQLHSSPYHPEGNALIETFHRTLRKGLLCLDLQSSRSLEFDELVQLTLYSYRASVHLMLGETPAFMTHGIDMLPPAAIDEKLLICHSDAKERIEMLNGVRLNIMVRSFARELAAEQANISTGKVTFASNDLVLVLLPPAQLAAESVCENMGRKLVPKWSMPCRIISVLGGGQRAVVKSLLSGRTQEVHISRARFLNAPVDKYQKKLWGGAVTVFLEKIEASPEVRQRMLNHFFEELQLPQTGYKRTRPDVKFGAAD